jgi:hypothetical protein
LITESLRRPKNSSKKFGLQSCRQTTKLKRNLRQFRHLTSKLPNKWCWWSKPKFWTKSTSSMDSSLPTSRWLMTSMTFRLMQTSKSAKMLSRSNSKMLLTKSRSQHFCLKNSRLKLTQSSALLEFK